MGEIRGRIPVLVGLAILGLSIGGLLGRHQTPAPPAPAPVLSEADRLPEGGGAETVAVHVSGMVMSPGVVDVPAGSIVADVIDAAGGLLPTALIDRINLAARSPLVTTSWYRAWVMAMTRQSRPALPETV